MKPSTNQFIATAIVNILALCHGCGLGWSSPAIDYFASGNSHLHHEATRSDLSWIGSAVSIGALVATVVSGFIAEFIGKKKTLMVLAFPNLIFWVVAYLATESYEVIIARFIAGMTGGGLFRVLALYISDISENHLRGGLSSIFPLTMYTGMMLMFIMGTYLDYFTTALILIPFPILAFLLMFFLPETPHFLIEHDKMEQAEKSLKFYRSCTKKSSPEEIAKIEEEFEMLKNSIKNAKSVKLTWADFRTKRAQIGLSIGIFYVFLLSCSGNSIIMMYTAVIFKISGSSLSPNDSAIVLSVLQIIGIMTMGVLVDRIGRKILMATSCVGSALSLILMAIYLLFKDTSDQTWMPLTLLSFDIFFNSIGISSLPFVMCSELVPFKIREASSLLCMLIVSVFMFITLKVFPAAITSVGISACFWFFGIVSVIGIIITVFFMPETKGKDLFE